MGRACNKYSDAGRVSQLATPWHSSQQLHMSLPSLNTLRVEEQGQLLLESI
jgi:hypothetical protein